MVTVLIIGLLLGMTLLIVPLSLGYDSREKVLQGKWFGLSFTKKLRPRKPPRKRKKKKKTDKTIWRGLLADRGLALELLKKTVKFVVDLGRTLSFQDTEVRLSLPDPAWNGVLYGILTNLDLKNVQLSVNFYDENHAKLWVTLYPYRVAFQVAVFMINLPGIRIVKAFYKHRRGK